MAKGNEFTVSGLDILNLVAGIDNRLNEVKEVSDKYKEEHPVEPEPDYKNMSIKLVNRVIRNILNGWKDDLPYILQQKLIADMEDNFGGEMTINMVDGESGVKVGSELIKKQICSSKSKNNGLSGENPTISGLVNSVVKGLV